MARDIFDKTIDKLVSAQEYELKVQQKQSVRVAQQVYLEKGRTAMGLFNREVKAIVTEYTKMHALIEFYKKKVIS